MNEEQRWIAAARNGDQESFEKLVRLYEKRVFSLTSRMCRNSADAEEAAQEAFLAAWQALPAFRGDASFATWLYRLVSNACGYSAAGGTASGDGRPLSGRRGEQSGAAGQKSFPHALAERAELRRQIEAGLAALPPEYRQVLILQEIHQCTYDEIAQICSIDLGTVKSRINRGRKRLRKILLESGNFSAAGASKRQKRRAADEKL